MEIKRAERKHTVIKMGLQGVSGSGKTYGALLLAKGLVGDWSKVAVIDTESHSADLYAHASRYAFISFRLSGQASRPICHPCSQFSKNAANCGVFADPPGLEPGLCGTKIRRVANYTMGHQFLNGAAKLEKF